MRRIWRVAPSALFQVWQQVNSAESSIEEDTIRTALNDLASIWDELFAPEKRRLTELLIKRVELETEQATIYYQPNGMNTITHELKGGL